MVFLFFTGTVEAVLITQKNDILGCSSNPDTKIIYGDNENSVESGSISYCIDTINPSTAYIDINSDIDFGVIYLPVTGSQLFTETEIFGDNGLFSQISDTTYGILSLPDQTSVKTAKFQFYLKDPSQYFSGTEFIRESSLLANQNDFVLFPNGIIFNTAQYQQPTPSVPEPNPTFLLGIALFGMAIIRRKKRINWVAVN